MISVLIKKEKFGRTQCEDESRDGGDTPTSQGMPKISRKPPEASREAGMHSPTSPLEGTSSPYTLILVFCPLER